MTSTNPRLVQEFAHDAPLLSCLFDPTGKFVLAGARDRFVQCVDLASQQKTLLEGHQSWVSALARSPLTNRLFTADYVGRLICWYAAGGVPRPLWNVQAHTTLIRGMAVSRDGQWVATGGSDGSVRLWSTTSGQAVREFAGHAGQVYALVFHGDGKHLVSADRMPRTPQLKQWDLETGQQVGQFDASELSAYRRGENIEWGGVRGLALSPDGSRLACCGRNKYAGPCCVLLFDWRTGEQTTRLRSTMKGVFHAVRFHADGFLVAAGGDISAGELCCWDPKQEEPLAITKTSGPCLALDLHPDGERIAVAQSIGKRTYPEDGAIGIYDMSAS